eukprot:598189-Pyramimonas_sp.AAC.1
MKRHAPIFTTKPHPYLQLKKPNIQGGMISHALTLLAQPSPSPCSRPSLHPSLIILRTGVREGK